MKTVKPENISLWIVSFRRLDALRQTVNDWLNSFPFEDVNIIVNDPTVDYAPIGLEFPQIRWYPNLFRSGWETGAISWCWNMCMRHTFETRDWCLMSQDDNQIRPGWDELITDEYDFYVAPHGDSFQLQSLAGFKAIGWFDERFRAIGGPEADYVLRAMQAIPDRISIHDEHIWQLRHNDVGLANHWFLQPKVGEVIDTRMRYNIQFATEECFIRWTQKWGRDVDGLFLDHAYNTPRQPGWQEIDWYPSFSRRLAELGR